MSAGSADYQQKDGEMPTPSALYQRAHSNVRHMRGHASEYFCRGFLRPCGRTAQEWAFQDRTGESFSVTITTRKDGKEYTTTRRTSMNAEDFEAMCKSCHKKMDHWVARIEAEEGLA